MFSIESYKRIDYSFPGNAHWGNEKSRKTKKNKKTIGFDRFSIKKPKQPKKPLVLATFSSFDEGKVARTNSFFCFFGFFNGKPIKTNGFFGFLGFSGFLISPMRISRKAGVLQRETCILSVRKMRNPEKPKKQKIQHGF